MSNFVLFVATLFGFFFISSANSQAVFTAEALEAQGVKQITEQEWKNIFVEKTYTATKIGENFIFRGYHDGAGRRILVTSKSRFERKYWFKDGQLCAESVRRNVDNLCYKYYRVRKFIYACTSAEGYACSWKMFDFEDGNKID